MALVEDSLREAFLHPLVLLSLQLQRRQGLSRPLGRLASQVRSAAFVLLTRSTTLPAVVVVRGPCKDSKEILSFLSSLDHHVKVLEFVFGHGIPHNQLVDSWLEASAKGGAGLWPRDGMLHSLYHDSPEGCMIRSH
jgi:hypothetical protein